MYNEKTLKSMEGTWVGDLLKVSEEEIQNAMDGIPEVKTQEESGFEKEEKLEDEQGIKFPFFLGEMSQHEKAMFALFQKKENRLKELCKQEADLPENSKEHDELHQLVPAFRDHMWELINKRFPDAPGNSKIISQGGKIFATKEQKGPMQEIIETLFEGAFPFGGVTVKVVH